MGDPRRRPRSRRRSRCSGCPRRRRAARGGSRCSWRRASEASLASWLGRLPGAITLTPSSTTVSPARVTSVFPPVWPARSMITEPGAMLRYGLGGVIRVGGAAVRDLRRGDDHLLACRVLGERLAHLLVLLIGERPGVAALVLGVGDEVELQRPAAEARYLLPGGAADVEAGDDGRRGAWRSRSPAARRRRRPARGPSPGPPCPRPWSSSGRAVPPRAQRAASRRSRRGWPATRARPSTGRA